RKAEKERHHEEQNKRMKTTQATSIVHNAVQQNGATSDTPVDGIGDAMSLSTDTAADMNADLTASNAADADTSTYSAFALKQMAKMGFTAGAGLGKGQRGITSPIEVQQKDTATGLGYDTLASNHTYTLTSLLHNNTSSL